MATSPSLVRRTKEMNWGVATLFGIFPEKWKLMTINMENYPSLVRSADTASGESQDRYMHATRGRLLAILIAAAAAALSSRGVVGRIEPLGLVAALAFLVAMGLEIWLLTEHPDKDWYGGRALAESAKTLTWKFVAGGMPFPMGDPKAALRLAEELAALLEDVPDIYIAPSSASAVTPWMASMRAAPLTLRRDTYIRERIDEQQQWYAIKAKYNRDRARWWKMLLIATELAGIAVALAKAFGLLHIDMASVTSAAIGAGAAWLGIKQHESLAHSYTFASHELGIISSRLAEVDSDDEWAIEVADAERAMSREHTMWRAARVGMSGNPVGPTVEQQLQVSDFETETDFHLPHARSTQLPVKPAPTDTGAQSPERSPGPSKYSVP